MLNIRIWLFALILVAVIVIGLSLGMGFRKGKCILCKLFKDSEDIIEKAKKEGKLEQDDANVLVSNLVKLGNVLETGTFEISEGNEKAAKDLLEILNEYNYSVDYVKILAVTTTD